MANRARVMIVDDSPTIKYEVRVLLNKIGADVVEVSNELGMFMKIEEYGKIVDLIIMDISLEYGNGFDLIKKLKSIDKYKDIPVIVLSAHADANSVLTAKKLGVAGYVRKPIRIDEFLTRMGNILETENKKIG